jgi:serine/threonine protein kinase
MAVFVAASGERYRVIDALGAGGFASVVRVEDGAGDQYALKHSRLGGFGRERLRNEADSLRHIDSANVVRYVSAGSEPVAFVVLELAADGNLQQRVDDARDHRRRIPLETILDWGLQLLDGLAAVHRHVLHCDVRAGNVLFRRAVPKIADFGSARQLSRTDAVGPLDTAAVSTPPEGWLSARCPPPSPAYDLYGLGVILFQLATLRPPFVGSREEVRLQHLLRCPPRPAQFRHDLPEPLERFILQLLEKDPAARGGSAELCRAQLSQLAAVVSGPEQGA